MEREKVNNAKSLGDRWIDFLILSERLRKEDPQAYAEMFARIERQTKSRCSDRPKSSDRQTWFDTHPRRERATESSVERLSCAGIEFLKSRHRLKIASESPLPAPLVYAVVNEAIRRLYHSFRSTTDPDICRADNASAKETAKVESQRRSDPRRDFEFTPDWSHLRRVKEGNDPGRK